MMPTCTVKFQPKTIQYLFFHHGQSEHNTGLKIMKGKIIIKVYYFATVHSLLQFLKFFRIKPKALGTLNFDLDLLLLRFNKIEISSNSKFLANPNYGLNEVVIY